MERTQIVDEQLEHIPHKALRMMDCTHYGSQMIENHSKDRFVKDMLMMELVMHTEKNDIVFHMEKTGMLMLAVEVDVGGTTGDVVDKLTCSSDDVRNRTLIEAARTMLADSKLPTTFWAKAVNTACYVQNKVLVVKPHFKTPYELFKGRSHALSFMRPFGCHVTILNTLDQLGKFDGKSDEGIFVGYFTISKAFRVYNNKTRKVKENLHITFLENKPMIAGRVLGWLFDIDALSESMNYAPVPAGTNSNDLAGKGTSFNAGQSSLEIGSSQDYILIPLWKDNSLFDSSSQDSDGHNKDKHVNTATPTYTDYPSDPLMPDLEDTGIFDDVYDDRDEGAEADYNNLETIILTRKMAKQNEAGLLTFINKQGRTNHKHFQNCLFAFLLSQMEPKKRSLSTEFEQLKHKRFQMSSMRELTFFLGLQVEWQKDGIFLSQDKYVCDILKKFGFSNVKSVSTPIETHKPLSKDANGTDVDVYLYRSMIGSLMYLTSSRPDIMFAGQPTLGLSYPKDSPLELIAYSDNDYAGASLDRKSTTGGLDYTLWILRMECKSGQVMKIGLELKGYLINNGYADLVQHDGKTATGKEFSNPLMAGSLPKTISAKIVDFLSSCSITYALTVSPTIYASYIEQFWNTASSKTINFVKQIHAIVDGKVVVISESSVRSDLLFDDEDGNGYRWQSQAPRNHGGTSAQTRSERVLEQPNDHLPQKVFITLTKRLKKLEIQLKQKRSRAVIHSLDEEEPSVDIKDSPKQGRIIEELNKDENVNLETARQEHEKYNLEKTLKLQRKSDKREEDVDKGDQTKEIDWNDPTVLRYHAFQNRPFSKAEVEEMKLYMRIVPDEDIAIDAIPLATKPSVIVEYKIVKEGNINTYHIIRADGSTKRYTSMINLLENIDREDLEAL
uniref:Ribonuclease H-like domain-containing protein n=1 Tax=Tanacetum cinerariifolium TaxID=118510 RepID=A0A6L2N715_TANCI|nr:ribonuclease H-like domain-containing protein [Tanacetum cinerariifolium]